MLNDILSNIYLQGGVVMLATNSLMQILKQFISTKFIPIFALTLPCLFGVLTSAIQNDGMMGQSAFVGLVVGMASISSYDLVHSFTKSRGRKSKRTK